MAKCKLCKAEASFKVGPVEPGPCSFQYGKDPENNRTWGPRQLSHYEPLESGLCYYHEKLRLGLFDQVNPRQGTVHNAYTTKQVLVNHRV